MDSINDKMPLNLKVHQEEIDIGLSIEKSSDDFLMSSIFEQDTNEKSGGSAIEEGKNPVSILNLSSHQNRLGGYRVKKPIIF